MLLYTKNICSSAQRRIHRLEQVNSHKSPFQGNNWIVKQFKPAGHLYTMCEGRNISLRTSRYAIRCFKETKVCLLIVLLSQLPESCTLLCTSLGNLKTKEHQKSESTIDTCLQHKNSTKGGVGSSEWGWQVALSTLQAWQFFSSLFGPHLAG